MPIYRTTAPLIEYCKKLQNFKNHFGVVEAAGSNPVTPIFVCLKIRISFDADVD